MPVDYWSQFVNTENVSPNLDHLIIENSNCYSTPDKSKSAFAILRRGRGHVCL